MEATTMNAKKSDQDKQYNEAKHQVGQAVDYDFGAGTTKTVEGRADQAIGYTEAQVGHAVGDRAAEFDGVKRAVRGTAEGVVGQAQYDLATLQTQIEMDVAALKAEMTNLKAEYTTATGEARAKVQASMDTTKANMQATQARVEAAIISAQEVSDEKLLSLQEQAAQSTGEAKAKIEARTAQARSEYKQ